jgi:hypothetical protein
MAIREQTVCSVGELIDAVTPPDPDPKIGRRRDTGVYHGASAAWHALLTSLDRLGGTEPPHTKAHLEAHILRNFIRYSRPYLPAEPTDAWELLVVAQHHTVPTRLLDWSYSPLVAAHFAIRASAPGQDCAVWRLDWQRVHAAFKLPALALLIEDLRHLFGKEQAFTPWNLFSNSSPAFACMIEPPSLDARIIAQAAVFTLCSDTRQSFDAFLHHHGLGESLTKFIIPASATAHFGDQLDLVAVDERRLFPGLDGVAAALRRYYC